MKTYCIILGGILVAALIGQASLPKPLEGHLAALKNAQSFTAVYTVQRIPAPPEEYRLSLGKPNMFRLETPTAIIVCDGALLTQYDKAANTYTQSPAATTRIAFDDTWAWSVFFNPEGFKELKGAAIGNKRSIKGNSVTEVTAILGARTITFYIDNKLEIARGYSLKTAQDETLVLASEIKAGAEALDASEFKFVPPAGAKLAEKPAVEEVLFARVKPIFDSECTGCHSGAGADSRFDASSRDGILRGGRRGAAVVVGDADNSPLIAYLRRTRQPFMPKGAAKLSEKDIDLIANWIRSGAKP